MVDDAVVADDPRWWQVAGVDGVAVVPVPAGAGEVVAGLLDLPLASSQVDAVLTGEGEPEDVPAAVVALLPGVPDVWWRHEELEVAGVPVAWWVVDDEVHAVHVQGLAAGLAWVAGRWAVRGAVAALLTDPDDGEAALDAVLG